MNRIKLLSGLLLLIAISGCHSASHKTHKIKKANKVSQNDKVELVTLPCAVIVSPDDKFIEKLKKATPADDFYTIADDNQYYMSTAETYLDSVKVKTMQKESRGNIVFKTTSGEIYKLSLDTLGWNILLFNAKSKPIKADLTAINTDYESYMKNK